MAAENQRAVTVHIGALGDSAQRVVQARALRGGFQVTGTSPGLITVGPYQLKSGAQNRVTLHINLLADSAVVSGTGTNAAMVSGMRSLGGVGAASTVEGEAIKQATKGYMAEMWSELMRLSQAIAHKP